MGRHKLFYLDANTVRDRLNEALDLATVILADEQKLIAKLHAIDRQRLYVRYGYNSLSGFCRYALGFSRTQTQRLVTQVRRFEPMANFVDENITRCRQ